METRLLFQHEEENMYSQKTNIAQLIKSEIMGEFPYCIHVVVGQPV